MRAASILVAAMITAAPATAQTTPPPAAVPADDLIRQQLLNAQQEIRRLRGELADQAARAARIDTVEAKNRRLVEIGNELIAAYGKRYRRSSFGPFQLARRRFEAELQDTGDRIYQNRADVPAASAAAPSPDGTSPDK